MTNDKITITDALTGETIERQMTDEEQAVRSAFLVEVEAEANAQAEAEEKAAADKAVLLAKLGITADEAKLLLS
jgi:hypothetical protein